MRKLILYFLISFAMMVLALDKPINYVSTIGANGGTRGVQQQANNFAAWNFTTGNWKQVLPPNVPAGTLKGIIAVGDGLLAYGSFNAIGGRTAAGIAYYDGRLWAAPEGIGLYTLNYNSSYSYYDNIPSQVGTGFAAVAVGNTVYLLGTFDQVGNIRDGVAGFVALTWSAGGIFSIGKIGQGYYKTNVTVPSSGPCAQCTGDTANSPPFTTGNRNKLRTYTANSIQYFVLQPSSSLNAAGSGDLWQWQVNTPSWIQITAGNGAINITGNVNDFEIVNDATPSIYVVGNFQRLNDPVATFRYLHIAVSNDQGTSFQTVAPVLNTANFGDVTAILNSTYGFPISPASNGLGLFSIAIPNGDRTKIFLAGAYRVNGRLPNIAYANELQTVVFQLTSSGIGYQSARFASTTAFSTVSAPDTPVIHQLTVVGSNLYIFGAFNYYNQFIQEGNPINRFNIRYTEGYKGVAVLNLNSLQVAPAFGGFMSGSNSDALLTFGSTTVFSAVSPNSDVLYFASPSNQIFSTYNLLSGPLFQYGGDAINNQTNKWNTIFGNRRFVSNAQTGAPPNAPYPYITLPAGADGLVYSLHITRNQDVLIFGGIFDFIGTTRVPGIGFYNPDTGTFGSVGSGLFRYDNLRAYAADSTYYNRVGGTVIDITERDGLLFAAGLFNRNNTGHPLYNIACIPFRTGGAGWQQVDGGCDNQINDLLIQDNLLYATGSFRYCGLNPEGYNGGLWSGRIPTSGIAVIDLSLDPTKQSWRPLGLGLQGTANGRALAWYRGQLYVGGTFSSAGGAIASDGIARWDGNKWRDVVSQCLNPCDRPTNVLPFMLTEIPTAAERKPVQCDTLSALNGNLYCVTAGTNLLNWWDGSLWHRPSDQITVRTPASTFQNNLIVNNGSNTNYIVISGAASQNSPGDWNYYNFNTDTLNYEPAFTGFSQTVLSIVSSANSN